MFLIRGIMVNKYMKRPEYAIKKKKVLCVNHSCTSNQNIYTNDQKQSIIF